MRLEERLRGLVCAELFAVEPEALLNACLEEDLPILRPRRFDAFTLRFELFERDLPRLQALAARQNAELRVLSTRGGSSDRRLLLRRRGLLLALALLAAGLFLSSLFVWEIRFSGAEDLSRSELLRELEDCGFSVGSFGPSLDADALRDRMLLRDGRLVWMTVDLHGSVAEVRLLRRSEKPEILSERGASELRASRTGIVRRLSVLRGQAQVQPGRAVVEGELLVSGSVGSLSAGPRTLRAQGEVWAETWYELSAFCPARGKESAGRGSLGALALKIGGKRINFYQKAGKAIDGCDKIVHEYNLGIDGLFRLPLTFVREELRPYRATEDAPDLAEEAGQRLIASLAERIDGQILSAKLSFSEKDGLTVVTLRAHCLENIAESVDITQ